MKVEPFKCGIKTIGNDLMARLISCFSCTNPEIVFSTYFSPKKQFYFFIPFLHPFLGAEQSSSTYSIVLMRGFLLAKTLRTFTSLLAFAQRSISRRKFAALERLRMVSLHTMQRWESDSPCRHLILHHSDLILTAVKHSFQIIG